MNNNEKIKYLEIQKNTTIIIIITTILSYLLTLDEELKLKNKKRIFNKDDADALSKLKGITIFIVSIIFLYVSYKEYLLDNKKNSNQKNELLLNIFSDILSVISALIGLYVIFKNDNGITISDTESL